MLDTTTEYSYQFTHIHVQLVDRIVLAQWSLGLSAKIHSIRIVGERVRPTQVSYAVTTECSGVASNATHRNRTRSRRRAYSIFRPASSDTCHFVASTIGWKTITIKLI